MAIDPAYPPSLSTEQLNFLLSETSNWSILHGLTVRPSDSFVPKSIDPSGALAVTAPVTLFPSLFPQKCFEEARAIQTAYNELYAAIARDEKWLSTVVEEYAEFLLLCFPKKICKPVLPICRRLYRQNNALVYPEDCSDIFLVGLPMSTTS